MFKTKLINIELTSLYQDRPSSGWEWENGFIKMDTLEVDAQDLISHRTENG